MKYYDMKFQLVVLGIYLIFYTYGPANFKSIGNNTMKKMLLILRWPCCTGCSTDVYLFQNKPAAVAPKKPSPIISSFLELGRKDIDAAKICGGAENVKTETSKHS